MEPTPARKSSRLITHQMNEVCWRASLPIPTQAPAYTPTKMAPAMPTRPARPTMATCRPTAAPRCASCVPLARTIHTAACVTATKMTVRAISRTIRPPMGPAGFSCSGSSRTVRTVISMAMKKPAMMMPTVSQILPPSTSGPTKMTRKAGRSSMTALTPEARPRWFSGTRSGISPCSAPWATLEETCRSTMPVSRTA